MYLPAYAVERDEATLLAFMREHPFATLITAPGGAPFATHLPLLIEEEGGALYLRLHVARANAQWQHLRDDPRALVVFQGPHALVHPAWYAGAPNVPTWNYTAVHASVEARVLPDAAAAEVARAMLRTFTPDAPPIPDVYEARLLQAVVTFELRVTRLEGKFKLSQNKSPEDRAAVEAHLALSPRAEAQATAALMRARRSNELK